MRKSNFALRLQPSLMAELRRAVKEDQTTLNQYINVAVAEKLASRRAAEQLFAQRGASADVAEALRVLDSLGSDEQPQPGDRVGRNGGVKRARRDRCREGPSATQRRKR